VRELQVAVVSGLRLPSLLRVPKIFDHPAGTADRELQRTVDLLGSEKQQRSLLLAP
jgi:hypothetical protein